MLGKSILYRYTLNIACFVYSKELKDCQEEIMYKHLHSLAMRFIMAIILADVEGAIDAHKYSVSHKILVAYQFIVKSSGEYE